MTLKRTAARTFGTRYGRWLLKYVTKSAVRLATSLPQEALSVALCARDIIDPGLPQTLEAQETLQALRSLVELDAPIGLESLHREIDAIMMDIAAEEPEVVSTGSAAGTYTGDDVSLRAEVVGSFAAIAE